MPFRYSLFLKLQVVFLLLAHLASGQRQLADIPDPKTLGETFVSNPDRVLSAGTVKRLNAQLTRLDQSGRAHIDVVVVRSVGELVPKEVAYMLFNRWKIGQADTNNGVLMLLVLDQRRVEFETGFGLEGDLPDAICYRIQQRFMLPALRAGQYDKAVVRGVDAIIRHLTGSPILANGSSADTVPETAAQSVDEPNSAAPAEVIADEVSADAIASAGLDIKYRPDQHFTNSAQWVIYLVHLVVALLLAFTSKVSTGGRWLVALGLLVVPLAAAYLLFPDMGYGGLPLLGLLYGSHLAYSCAYFYLLHRRFLPWLATRNSRHWQYVLLRRAHHHLGWTAFVFPLPLALYWLQLRRRLHHLRHDPYPCSQCGSSMRQLDEQQDDAFLQPGNVVEERVGSIDYDVWQCAQCQATLTLAYQDLHSPVEVCSDCQYVTLRYIGKEEVKAATEYSEGWGWRLYECAHCGHERKDKYTIPQITRSTSSRSYSSSGSSSSGGGGFSSSSGGSSGGGGAGSSW